VNDGRATETGDRVGRVRVWFGRFAIVDYRAPLDSAASEAAGLGRRFSGLRVTVEPDEPMLARRIRI
jgi:hypothetical protein